MITGHHKILDFNILLTQVVSKDLGRISGNVVYCYQLKSNLYYRKWTCL